MDKIQNYFCSDLFTYKRRKTVKAKVGEVTIGSMAPICIQTMLTTKTSDIKSTVEQCLKLAKAGAELIRLTVINSKDAEHLAEIRKLLSNQGCTIPLVADVHFNPSAAETAAKLIEKVRINPGNFVDKQARLSEEIECSSDIDLKTLETKFRSLVNLCKSHNTALRIGTNHGSLSSRIMDRYGDTPLGMVESAMEFLRICKQENFNNVIVSMKASNTRIMVHAYRLLVQHMNEEEMLYPLHLGVTEAGDAEDGRIKSAVGIGTLLADGLGDTIRVSLTEIPENEIPVAKKIVNYFKDREGHKKIKVVPFDSYNPYEYIKRKSNAVGKIGGKNNTVVVADLSHLNPIYKEDIESLGYILKNNIWKSNDNTPDYIYSGESIWNCDNFGLKVITNDQESVLFCKADDINSDLIKWLKLYPDTILMVKSTNKNRVSELRSFFLELNENKIYNPVIICFSFTEEEYENLQIKAACDFGALLIDGFADGIMITNKGIPESEKLLTELSFNILQASRVRFTRTEFIACPGCGRTLFDLKETLKLVKEATYHLKGLKIAVMGCIVNGPGEMADADYGYVGAGNNKVTLYKGKKPVKKNILQENAIKELIELIKDNGDWI